MTPDSPATEGKSRRREPLAGQRLAQRRDRLGALLGRLAGRQAHGLAHAQVMLGEPAREGRQVVGREGHEGAFRVVLGRPERAAPVALEQHHLVGPQAEPRDLLAKSVRNGAEILADHDTAVRRAFLGDASSSSSNGMRT